MMKHDFRTNHGLPVSKHLQLARIKKCPINGDGNNIIVEDYLETKGFIKIYEYNGDTFYLPMGTNTEVMKHLKDNASALIAGVTVSLDRKTKKVGINQIFCKYGKEEYISILLKQVLNFVEFYNYTVMLDLKKESDIKSQRKCCLDDGKYWLIG